MHSPTHSFTPSPAFLPSLPISNPIIEPIQFIPQLDSLVQKSTHMGKAANTCRPSSSPAM